MTILSDIDIRKTLGKDIVIEPFALNLLTPVGYDFTVGDFVYSLEEGLLELQNDCYILPAKNTVQILTKESLWVSGRIAGTFHSKVSLVSKGFSHISTTLDPGWYGPNLITMRNNTNKEFLLKVGSPFVTLIFFKVQTPTRTPSSKPAFRRDILTSQLHDMFTSQLNDQTEKYFKKIESFLSDQDILEKFKQEVEAANHPARAKIWASVQARGRRELTRVIAQILIVIALGFSVTFQLYWDTIKWLFHNISYDSAIVTAQIALVAALLSALFALRKK